MRNVTHAELGRPGPASVTPITKSTGPAIGVGGVVLAGVVAVVAGGTAAAVTTG